MNQEASSEYRVGTGYTASSPRGPAFSNKALSSKSEPGTRDQVLNPGALRDTSHSNYKGQAPEPASVLLGRERNHF